jgi:hypothetical protein
MSAGSPPRLAVRDLRQPVRRAGVNSRFPDAPAEAKRGSRASNVSLGSSTTSGTAVVTRLGDSLLGGASSACDDLRTATLPPPIADVRPAGQVESSRSGAARNGRPCGRSPRRPLLVGEH